MPQGWWSHHRDEPGTRLNISINIITCCSISGRKVSKQRADDQARDGKFFTSTNCWFRMFAEFRDVLWVIHKEKKRICKKYY